MEVSGRCLTCGALGTATDVSVLPVLAGASVLAGLTQALVDVGLAQAARVARAAVAGEGGQAVLAGAIVARVRVALVHVRLAVLTGVTWRGRRKGESRVV